MMAPATASLRRTAWQFTIGNSRIVNYIPFVPSDARNPFEFGRELDDTELVDRRAELDRIERSIRNRGKLFLIGPRRYGKTSILSAVEKRFAGRAVILRFDAEAYESLDLLAQAILSGAAASLAGTVERASKAAAKFFATLRPEVSFDLTAEKIKVTVAPRELHRQGEVPTLAYVLAGVNAMAKGHAKPVAVILDEFQQVVLDGGVTAEKQLRAEIQTHRHAGYVFAGSKTRLLADMTGDPARAFWKLGERMFLGPVPRADFLPFLRDGFRSAATHVEPAALDRLMDVAEDVPYNVQRLAYVAWELLRTVPRARLDVEAVDRALATLVRQEYPAYAQLWAALTKTQKKVLKAVIMERGRALTASEVLKRYELAASTMHKTLKLLDDKGVVREEEGAEFVYRLEDPFLGAWLKEAQDL